MRILWLVLSLIPVSFFFHFYENGQHIKGEEAPFLFLSPALSIGAIGLLSASVKIRHVILINILATGLSILLAMYFIPNDSSWFKPLKRDMAVIFVSTLLLIGQLFVRSIVIFTIKVITNAKRVCTRD